MERNQNGDRVRETLAKENSRPLRTSRTWGLLLLLLSLLLGGGLRWMEIKAKSRLDHDEPISYLAATGHMGEYQRILRDRSPPYAQWAEARDWKRLWHPEDKFCFSRIARELAESDVHPPMYFWLLHVWSLMVGVHLWTGPALNLIIALTTAVFLYRLALSVFGDGLRAGLVALLWCASPNVISISIEARHYDLLALAAVMFVSALIRCVETDIPKPRSRYVSLAGATAFGLLTHYHFPILAGGGAVYVLWRLARRDRRRLGAVALSMLAGGLAFMALHPHFYHSFGSAAGRMLDAEEVLSGDRIQRMIRTYADFLISAKALPAKLAVTAQRVAALAIGGLVLFSLIGQVRRSTRQASAPESFRGDAKPILFFLLLTVGANVGLYLGTISPFHAMGPRYGAMVWPFLAFAPLLALRRWRRWDVSACGFLLLVVLASSWSIVRLHVTAYRALGTPEKMFADFGDVIVDKVERGWLPRVLWFCPDVKRVFAAPRSLLVNESQRWLPGVGKGTFYVALKVRRNVPPQVLNVLKQLASRFKLTGSGQPFWDMGTAWVVLDEKNRAGR